MKALKKTTTFLPLICIVSIIAAAGFFFMLNQPPQATENNTQTTTKKVMSVKEKGDKDINFSLGDDSYTYYIQDGLDKGLFMEELRDLEGQQVIITYIDQPQDDLIKSHRIAKLVLGKNIVIYNELKD